MKRMSRPHLKQEAFSRVASLTADSGLAQLERLVKEEVTRLTSRLGTDLISRYSTWNAAKIQEEMERALRNDRRARVGRKPRLTADCLKRLDAWLSQRIRDEVERTLKEGRLAAKRVKEISA